MEILRNDVVFRKKVILTSKMIQNTGLIPYMKPHTYGSKCVMSLKTVFTWKTMKIVVKVRFFGDFGAFDAHNFLIVGAKMAIIFQIMVGLTQVRPQMNRETKGLIYKSLNCLLYTSPSPRDRQKSRMPSSA